MLRINQGFKNQIGFREPSKHACMEKYVKNDCDDDFHDDICDIFACDKIECDMCICKY